MIVPVQITRGQRKGANVCLPVTRVDQWSLDDSGCVLVEFGTSAGILVDPDESCTPIKVGSVGELYGLASLAYVHPELYEGGPLDLADVGG